MLVFGKVLGFYYKMLVLDVVWCLMKKSHIANCIDKCWCFVLEGVSWEMLTFNDKYLLFKKE